MRTGEAVLATELPGLQSLLEVVHKHEVPIEILPAGRAPPRAGERLSGMPVDPLLATAFSRCGKLLLGVLGSEILLLTRCDEEVNGFLKGNEEWQGSFSHDDWPDHFRALMLFGREMLYRYATVPELSNPEGLQPVVRVDPYEDIHALPVASDLDRFFETYSRYVEIMVADQGYQADGVAWVRFPYDVPELIARDRPLIELLREGRFDRWMYERDKTGRSTTADTAPTRAWVDEVLRHAGAST
jgi:hypothetical protein